MGKKGVHTHTSLPLMNLKICKAKMRMMNFIIRVRLYQGKKESVPSSFCVRTIEMKYQIGLVQWLLFSGKEKDKRKPRKTKIKRASKAHKKMP